MNRIELHIKKRFFPNKRFMLEFPSNWSEVTSDKLLSLMYYVVLEKPTVQSLHDIVVLHLPYKALKWIQTKHIYELSRFFSWIMNSKKNILDTPVLPSFHHNGIEYFLPAARFSNVKMAELITGQANSIRYLQGKGYHFLDKCIAAYCRPKSTEYDAKSPNNNGDPREPFHSKLHQKRAEDFATLDPAIKLYVHHFINGCMTRISSKKDYGVIFPKNDHKTEEEQIATINRLDPMTWWKFAIDAANLTNLGGDVDNILQKNIHTVFSAVAQHKRQAMEREQAQRLKT